MQTLELLTIPQVCEILKVEHKTVRREILGGRLAGTKIGKQWRFTTEALQDYIKSRTMKIKKVPS
jgi:excisionase family DNA binding protein